MRSARPIMVQGTGSGVGKSFLAAGLCRILSDMGIRVTPFKAQNMALNSYVTIDGGEIGRAQALQAEAARIEPTTDVNPILLKTQSDSGCQVIVNGRVHGSMSARQYYAHREMAWQAVTSAYDRLAGRYEAIVLEGAGSPAEINLARVDIVNMNMADYAGAPVLLVGDIDKGGVFASLYGTVGLLNGQSGRIKGFVINKFRGDRTILAPGLEMIREKTGIPVIGVLPWLGDLGLHEEDAIPQGRLGPLSAKEKPLRIAVVRFRSISNFTDFDPFLYEPDVDLFYTARPDDLERADLVILPGSKNTVKDLLRLRENGLDEVIRRLARRGVPIVGICGGYQMLGRTIRDPHRLESAHEEVAGLGLLDTTTTLEPVKITRRVRASVITLPPGILDETLHSLSGYEIHLGRTETDVPLFELQASGDAVPDGSANGLVWGTYLHGIFDNDGLRRALLNGLRMRKGLGALDSSVHYAALRENAIDRFARVLREHLDVPFILAAMGIR